jgi:orotate phosphoribosyltransferase
MQSTSAKIELIQFFHDLRAFQWNSKEGFRLASGKISPFYIDCRALLAHPRPRHLVAQLSFDILKNLEIDTIGGLEIGAIPLATTISDYGYTAMPSKEWRTFVVRKQAKDHGLGKLIEGGSSTGDQALIVDDVLTSGNSVIKAISAGQEAGLTIKYALVVVDRQEHQGKEAVETHNVQLFSLLTLDDLKKNTVSI